MNHDTCSCFYRSRTGNQFAFDQKKISTFTFAYANMGYDNKDVASGNTFIKAARVGHVNVIHMQLAAGMDVNTVDENGVGALYVAAREGHVDIIHVLLLHEVNKNKATKKGNVTALYAACSRGHIHAVRTLLDAGSDTDIAAQTGSTPLFIARFFTVSLPPFFLAADELVVHQARTGMYLLLFSCWSTEHCMAKGKMTV
jgi:hypothetical protein